MRKTMKKAPPARGAAPRHRSVTIKDLAAELELSITTISRALNGYSDVGEETRKRVRETAERLGYRPNRNAQRLVTRRTRNLGWVRNDNEGSFVDPHFVEVMAGLLRGARSHGYDLVVSAAADPDQITSLARHIAEGSVDALILDLPRPDDPRIDFLLDHNLPFVVHGRENRHDRYGWVDIDNRGIFRTLIDLLLHAGHRKIAFVNGDETYSFARERALGVGDALMEWDLPASTLMRLNTVHPMTHAGFHLTERIIAAGDVTAIVYSSALMAVEGISALNMAGIEPGRDIAVASMDDELVHLNLEPYKDQASFVHSSLRAAGYALAEEAWRQCEHAGPGRGHVIGTEFHVHKGLDESRVPEPWRAGRDFRGRRKTKGRP